jgi:hypothetical protein
MRMVAHIADRYPPSPVRQRNDIVEVTKATRGLLPAGTAGRELHPCQHHGDVRPQDLMGVLTRIGIHFSPGFDQSNLFFQGLSPHVIKLGASPAQKRS